MAQRQVGNSSIQTNALSALGSSSQDDSWIGTSQPMPWGRIKVMFTEPIGIKTKLLGIFNLTKELPIKSIERTRPILIMIKHREYTKLHGFFPSCVCGVLSVK